MIEIIKRKEGFKSEKEKLQGFMAQISYNSSGRICIRKIVNDEQDSLIVLDRLDSKELIKFCKKIADGIIGGESNE